MSEFKTRDEALNAALTLLEGEGDAKLQRLRRLIDEGDGSGPYLDWDVDAFLQEVKQEING